MVTKTRATIDDLRRVPGKAALINSGIMPVPMRAAYAMDVLSPDAPTVCKRGGMAQAEPAVPGWTMPDDDRMEQPSVE